MTTLMQCAYGLGFALIAAAYVVVWIDGLRDRRKGGRS